MSPMVVTAHMKAEMTKIRREHPCTKAKDIVQALNFGMESVNDALHVQIVSFFGIKTAVGPSERSTRW